MRKDFDFRVLRDHTDVRVEANTVDHEVRRYHFREPLVAEGVGLQKEEVLKYISDILGVLLVVDYDKYSIEVRKGLMFQWAEVDAQIVDFLKSKIKEAREVRVTAQQEELSRKLRRNP